MKKQITQKKMGFSLIELSIVILVIGLLVLGITKGSSIITKAKIGSAKSLTKGSPVALTDNLVAWYEPTLTTSFTQEEAFDGEDLTVAGGAVWFDNSPSRASNATAIIGTAPKYTESSTNSLPAVRFVAGALSFNSISLNQHQYTVFVVERRSGAVGDFLQLGLNSDAVPVPNSFGYSTGILLGSGTGAGKTGAGAVAAFGSQVSRISTFVSDPTSKRLYINGEIGAGTNSGVGTAALLEANKVGLLGSSGAVYVGDISEVIIFNRGLQIDERNDIQDYLSKKYSINVTDSAS
ncbi:MAG: Tfp pilus assembly major pilin PilA [Rickettsiales bacterium]|jgi:Tfp pilus assembly major pilin PilA